MRIVLGCYFSVILYVLCVLEVVFIWSVSCLLGCCVCLCG